MMLLSDPYHPGRLYCNTFNQAAYRSDDYGKSWKKIKGYDFHWGQRIIVDENDPEKIYITTFGSSVWHGVPEMEDIVKYLSSIRIVSHIMNMLYIFL